MTDAAGWRTACRRAGEAARAALARYPLRSQRGETAGRGEGGDVSLVIDRAVEDAVLAELEQLGEGLVAISEERGSVEVAGGGATRVVIDPIDGSRNARRGIPLYALSIAIAGGETMGDVEYAYVLDLSSGEEWWAQRGRGAHVDGERLATLGGAGLEVLGVEIARPALVAAVADGLAVVRASRVRALGSVALSLCWVAAGRLDGMLTLAPARSVDSAAGQLIVREAGGSIAFPEVAGDPLAVSLGLEMRSRVLAAASASQLERLTLASSRGSNQGSATPDGAAD